MAVKMESERESCLNIYCGLVEIGLEFETGEIAEVR